jgi:hypothetical protein
LAAFAALLVAGGSLGIVDLEEEDGSFHGEGFAGPHGFERTSLESMLRSAGFVDISFQTCHHMIRNGTSYPLFLATCTRA